MISQPEGFLQLQLSHGPMEIVRSAFVADAVLASAAAFPQLPFLCFFAVIPRADGAWPNLVCLNSVANALERSGDWKAALELLKRHLGKFS